MKICPFCGAQLPEEAIYCLNCASVLNERQIFPPVKEKKEKKKKAAILFPRKKLVRIVAVILPILIVTASCLFAIKSTKNNIPKSEEKKTSLVPVTDENGENVTDDSGEQIYEITEITETTTEKKGILDKLFNKNEDKSKDKDTSETTTKKPSLLDKILGNDKETEASSPTIEPESTANTISHTEPEVTINTTSSTESNTNNNEASTNSTESSTESTTEPIGIINPEDFEYTEYSSNKSHLSITKYNGNAEHVIVPATYNGKFVVEIRRDAFKDNNKVKIVTFEDVADRPYLVLNSSCFNSCTNLHTINMPNEDLGIINNFAIKCYAMKTITLKNSQWRFENGCLFYNSGRIWKLRYCCPASIPETLTLPTWCAGIEGACNLSEAAKIRVIYLHEYASIFPDQSNLPSSLEAIYVDDKNKNGYDINGIAFQLNTDGKYYCTYPPQNKINDFTLPENSFLFTAYIKNPYLETLRIGLTSELQSPTYITEKWAFKNLKTIYIKSGHKNEANIYTEFYGTVYTY